MTRFGGACPPIGSGAGSPAGKPDRGIEPHPTADSMVGGAFLDAVLAAFPYRIHTVPTDNGVAFTPCAATR